MGLRPLVKVHGQQEQEVVGRFCHVISKEKKRKRKGMSPHISPGPQFPWFKNFPVGATPKSTTLVTESSN